MRTAGLKDSGRMELKINNSFTDPKNPRKDIFKNKRWPETRPSVELSLEQIFTKCSGLSDVSKGKYSFKNR